MERPILHLQFSVFRLIEAFSPHCLWYKCNVNTAHCETSELNQSAIVGNMPTKNSCHGYSK